MDFNVVESMRGAAVIESQGEKFLAIDSGLKNRSFVGVDTSRLQSLPGLIVLNGEIKNWMLKGITELDGRTFFYGPYFKGKTLASSEINAPSLLRLTDALHTIKDRNFPVRQFSLSSVYLIEEEEAVLFFPPRLMEFLNSHRLREDSLEMIEPWNSPKLGGDHGRAFTIASLAYKVITDNIPFPGDNEEDIEKLISKKSYASPLLKEPLLHNDLVQLIDDSFSGKATLSQWRDQLGKWITGGITRRDVSEDEKENIIAIAQRDEKRRIRIINTDSFFLKHRVKLITGVVTAVVLALILQAPLSKFFADPVTAGLSQSDVVRLYYDCFRTLDTEVLEDTITSEAGKGDINEISTIYVTSKVRSSYEGSTGLIDAEQWIADGMNPVDPSQHVWGISDLKLKPLGNDSFEATYIKWTPAAVDDPNDTTPRVPEGEKIRDIIHLSMERNAWIIDQIQRIRE